MRHADTAQADRHAWLKQTLGLLKPQERQQLAARRGWPSADATPEGISRRFWTTDGLAGAAVGLPPGLANAVHFMAINQVVLPFETLLRYYLGAEQRYAGTWRMADLRAYLKDIRRTWLPWGWLLIHAPDPLDRVDARTDVWFHVPAEWRRALPPLAVPSEPLAGPVAPSGFWDQRLAFVVTHPGEGAVDTRTLGREAFDDWIARWVLPELAGTAGPQVSSAGNLLHLLLAVPPGRGVREAELLAAYTQLTTWPEVYGRPVLEDGVRRGLVARHDGLLLLAPEARWLVDEAAARPAPVIAKAPKPVGDRLRLATGQVDAASLVDLADVSDVEAAKDGWTFRPSPRRMGRRFGRTGAILEALPEGLRALGPWVAAAEQVRRDYGRVIVHAPLDVFAIRDPVIAAALARAFPDALVALDGPTGQHFAVDPARTPEVLKFLEKKQWPCKTARP